MSELESLVEAIHRLGTNHADTPMGALELLAKELKNGLGSIATALNNLAAMQKPKKPRRRKPTATVEAFVETIPTDLAPKLATLRATRLKLGVSRGAIATLLHEATKRGLVEIAKPKRLSMPHLIRRR